MLLFYSFASPFTQSPFPKHQEFIPERVGGCSDSHEHLSPSSTHIDLQVVVLLSCTNCLFTSPEKNFISFPQPLFSSINHENLPAESGKHNYPSNEHREVSSFLPLGKWIFWVLRFQNTMNIVL